MHTFFAYLIMKFFSTSHVPLFPAQLLSFSNRYSTVMFLALICLLTKLNHLHKIDLLSMLTNFKKQIFVSIFGNILKWIFINSELFMHKLCQNIQWNYMLFSFCYRCIIGQWCGRRQDVEISKKGRYLFELLTLKVMSCMIQWSQVKKSGLLVFDGTASMVWV